MSRPPEDRSAAGREAEAAVCEYLRGRGMRIVARNFRSARGEVDIVARDGDLLAFVEVRYRGRDDFGMPEESVGRVKRTRVVSAARAFLGTISPTEWKEARFDVAAVEDGDAGPVIRYYANAFDAKGRIL